MSWLAGSSAEVASSSTTMSGRWRRIRANASLCFLATGQYLVPGRILTDAVDEMFETDKLQRSRDLIDVSILSRQRIGDGPPQRADRNVGTLRHQEHFCACFNLDMAFAPGPQTGNGAHQRALAGARLSGNENPFAARDHDLGVLDHYGAVLERDREMAEP